MYKLAVRNREFRRGWIYCLCLVNFNADETEAYAQFLGWTTTQTILERGWVGTKEEDKTFAGANLMMAYDLYPCMPMTFDGLEYTTYELARDGVTLTRRPYDFEHRGKRVYD